MNVFENFKNLFSEVWKSGVSEDTLLSVKIEQFAASSIDIRLICFTKTADYLEWMKVKDALAIEIKNIVEKNNASFAFPSTSIYVEKN
jgi:MscS family membrane protein